MAYWLIQVLNGLSLAMLLFLVAAGLSVVMGLMRIVNVAHGSFYLVGAYIGLTMLTRFQNYVAALIVAGVSIALLGLLTYLLFRGVSREGDSLITVELHQILLGFGVIEIQLWSFDSKIRELTADRGKHEKAAKASVRPKEDAKLLESFAAGDITWLDEMARTSQKFPPPEAARVHELRAQANSKEGGSLTLMGVADDYETIKQMEIALREQICELRCLEFLNREFYLMSTRAGII